MNYLQRYRNGEYLAVWEELIDLGEVVNHAPHVSQAEAVATETMRRVRLNCERIINRLQRLEYVFGAFPDGTKRDYAVDPITRPSSALQADQEELTSITGLLPLSIKAFWAEVGAVDLVGMHPGWPTGLDPLVVEVPEAALAMLEDGEADGSDWFAALAPDEFHKDNVSGGAPYGVVLPDPSADFKFMYERHELFFVPYLRFAILQWGGFPGMSGREMTFEPLKQLTADLVPF